MSELLKKHQNLFVFAALIAYGALSGYYYSLMAIVTLVVMHFFYAAFYTKPPVIRNVFIGLGIGLALANVFNPMTHIISIYIFLAMMECVRISVMAVLRYPSTIKDLKALTDELEHRVEERTAELQEANVKLQEANARLKELDEMKSSFVSQASHDLRTPLTAIKGSLDNLSMGIAGELTEKQQKVLGRATRSVDRLTNLINEVLDLSRIESGRIVLEKARVSLRSIVEQSIQENLPAAEQKQIALKAEDMSDAFMLHADGGKLERIAGELLGNAIKYTPEGGQVDVRVWQDNEYVSLSVSDSGIGMTEEDCKRIWERFYRSSASKYFAKGSGLGLAIAKELVELHGGTLSVESVEKKGTVFTLRLPQKID